MALAVENGLIVHQMDVRTIFINGDIEEELCMDLPELFGEILPKIANEEKKGIKNIKKEDASKMLDQINEGNKFCLLRQLHMGSSKLVDNGITSLIKN